MLESCMEKVCVGMPAADLSRRLRGILNERA